MKKEQLLPKKLLASLPALGATSEEEETMIKAKFFYPDFSWTWYAIEFDGIDIFYGLVDGDVKELGSFRLSELMSNSGKLGLPIERDLHFTPRPLSEVWRETT